MSYHNDNIDKRRNHFPFFDPYDISIISLEGEIIYESGSPFGNDTFSFLL
jgi:hypothetical protein